MRAARFLLLIATLLTVPADGLSSAAAREPGVIAFGETREQLKQTPIEKRPYRPLHVYGNAVRRQHSRSRASAPRPSAQR